MRPVFATAFRWGSLRGEHTVGSHIDVSHVAPTPIGPHVKADVELLAVEGRKLRFRVWCFDALERIGEGTHERAIIRMASFLRRVEAKHLVAGKSG
jgi:fluoroacetyl-CoA thioesterase